MAKTNIITPEENFSLFCVRQRKMWMEHVKSLYKYLGVQQYTKTSWTPQRRRYVEKSLNEQQRNTIKQEILTR